MVLAFFPQFYGVFRPYLSPNLGKPGSICHFDFGAFLVLCIGLFYHFTGVRMVCGPLGTGVGASFHSIWRQCLRDLWDTP